MRTSTNTPRFPTKSFRLTAGRPQNYTGRYYGDVELSYVVEQSLNVSTVWLLHNKVKLENAFNFAEKAGIKLSDPDDKGYAALALGGLTEGASTIEMAQAYTVFPNNGKATRAHAIRKIEQADGTELELTDEAEEALQEVQVFQPRTAYYMTRMLRNVVEEGPEPGPVCRIARWPERREPPRNPRMPGLWATLPTM